VPARGRVRAPPGPPSPTASTPTGRVRSRGGKPRVHEERDGGDDADRDGHGAGQQDRVLRRLGQPTLVSPAGWRDEGADQQVEEGAHRVLLGGGVYGVNRRRGGAG